jgi:long-chain acyl-CoA synthetase
VNFWNVFDAAASRFEERTAIEVQKRDTTERHTYRQLRELAQARAASLAALGVRQGDRCAILADNDAWWCGAYLGILRLGAVAVPLDTTCSTGQVATILLDAGARVLFANTRLKPVALQAVAIAGGIVVLDLAAPLAPEGAGAPDALARHTAAGALDAPDAPAVILYTSGTTADPKGVVLCHANLVAARDAAVQAVSVSEHDSVLGVLPLFHALAQLANLILPFAAGARVVFLESVTSGEILRALEERKITVFVCVPQFFHLIHRRLLDEVRSGGLFGRVAFRGLLATSLALRRAGVNIGTLLFRRVHTRLGRQMRFFLTGGSRFDPALGRDFYALGFTVLQAYGLTETSGAATITEPDDAFRDTVGRALPGQQIKILPAADPGVDGEVAVRGPIVMQGYFNRPDATSAVMTDGWLRTGDLGRLDGDGRLTITGRQKEVIVLASGKNLYPEDIEAQYKKSPFIEDICVLGLKREGEPFAEQLYAVVVPDADVLRQRRIVNAGDLLRFEMEGQAIHLPPHQRVLGYEIWFEPLPRTTTGKLRRHEIERRLETGRRAGETIEESTDEASWANDSRAASAAAIIRSRVRGRPVGPDAHLELDLGLDSLERVELLTELEQRFAVRIDAERAHEILTVAQLIDAVLAGDADARPAPVQPAWSVLLKDVDSASVPTVSGLLDRRPVAVTLFFALSRLLRLLLGPGRVVGRSNLPRHGPYIISPNHQGYLDPMILCAALPYRVFRDLFFVGAAEYFETPLTRWLARTINLLPVDPDANLVSAMKASAFGLQRGKILVLFPEGERSIDGTVKRFKKGAPILAHHLGVPVVPVAIRGSFELWPRNRPIGWRVLLPFSGHRVRVAFGTPIRFERASEYGESACLLRDAVVKLWDAI